MKFLRAISSILSSVLAFILTIALVIALTAISAAHAINEKTIQQVSSSILQNDEVRKEISKEISAVAIASIVDFIKQSTPNSEDADKKIQSWEEAAPGYIDDFLSTPEVQEMIGNIAADYAMAALSNQDPQNISLSSRLNDLISENGTMVDEKFEKIFSDQNLSEEAAREKLTAYAAEQNITISSDYNSYSEVISEIVKGSQAKIDSSAQDIFGKIIPSSSADQSAEASSVLSYHTATFPSPMLAVQFAILGLEVNFNENQTPLEIFLQILNILQNPIMYLIIAAFLVISFILLAFFSFSFKKPFLFTGISTAVTGILLIVFANYPIPFDWITNQVSTGNSAFDSAIANVLPTIWSSVSSILTIHAIITIIISALFFLSFILLRKRKTY